MIFEHEIQDVNLIITSLEHKIRDMQILVQKLMAKANEQMPVQTQVAPVTETRYRTNPNNKSNIEINNLLKFTIWVLH